MNKILRVIRRRNIKSNLKQFLSVVLIMFLSTTLLFGFIVNAKTLKSATDNYYAQTNLANIWVYTDNVSTADYEFFENNFDKFTQRLYISTSSSLVRQEAENNTKIYVLPSDLKVSAAASIPYLERGEVGCLIDKNLAENYDIIIKHDDILFDIEVDIGGQQVVVPLKFRITGTMNFVECADIYLSWPVVIDENVFLRTINAEISKLVGDDSQNFDAVPYNQVAILAENQTEASQKIQEYYTASQSKLLYLGDRNSVETVVLLDMEVSQAQKMIYVFPIIFLIVSVMIILTTINQLIIQEKGKIGTLKSIGVPDKKVLRHYSSYGAYLCGIGALAGLIFGPIIVPNVMFIKYNLVYSIPEDFIKTKIPWLFAGLVFAMMTILGFVVSYLASHEILHKKPIECMKHQVNIKLKSRNKKPKLNLPIWLKMAVRNIRVKPVRTVMATIGIAGCAALLTCGFGIGDTLTYGINNDFKKLFTYDISSTYKTSNFEEKLLNIEGVEAYELYSENLAKVSSVSKTQEVKFLKFANNSQFAKFKVNDNGVVVSRSVANDLQVKKGDTIAIEINDVKVEVLVLDTVKTCFENGIFACSTLGLNLEGGTQGVWIAASSNKAEIVSQLNQINGTKDAVTKADIISGANDKIGSINSIMTTLKVFAILLAVIVLFNLVMLILKERVKDIATMKVVGQNIFSIGLSIVFEMLIMSLIGTALGLVLGFPVLVLVLSINKVKILNYLYFINPFSYIFTFLIIFVTIIIIGLISLLWIKNINMIQSLKSVE